MTAQTHIKALRTLWLVFERQGIDVSRVHDESSGNRSMGRLGLVRNLTPVASPVLKDSVSLPATHENLNLLWLIVAHTSSTWSQVLREDTT